MAEEGRELYGRLLLLKPEQLAQGGLPLEEVQQGMEEWSRLKVNAIM